MTFWKEIMDLYHLDSGFEIHATLDEDTNTIHIPLPHMKHTKGRSKLVNTDMKMICAFLEDHHKIARAELYLLFRRTYADARAKPRYENAMQLLYESAKIDQKNGMIFYYKYTGD